MNEHNTRAGPWTGVFATLAVVAIAITAYLWWNRTRPAEGQPISLPMVFRTPGGLLEVSGTNATETEAPRTPGLAKSKSMRKPFTVFPMGFKMKIARRQHVAQWVS
jgi:hypothetical protein